MRTGSRGFTIIEVLVVVTIIVILLAITVSVGLSVKSNAAIRSTHATLKSLEGMMADYRAEGNAEPDDPTAPGFTANADMNKTTPMSDATRWIKILESVPPIGKQLHSLPTMNIPDPDAPGNSTPVILDAFGTPIRYIPFNSATKRQGYFQSAGPDRTFDNPSIAPTTPLAADDLYSYDP